MLDAHIAFNAMHTQVETGSAAIEASDFSSGFHLLSFESHHLCRRRLELLRGVREARSLVGSMFSRDSKRFSGLLAKVKRLIIAFPMERPHRRDPWKSFSRPCRLHPSEAAPPSSCLWKNLINAKDVVRISDRDESGFDGNCLSSGSFGRF